MVYKKSHKGVSKVPKIFFWYFANPFKSTVSTHIKLHSWLNHQYSKIWINLHFFGPKVHFLRLFEAFMGKIFNKPPPWNPHILINLRRFICVGTVYIFPFCPNKFSWNKPQGYAKKWRFWPVTKTIPNGQWSSQSSW